MEEILNKILQLKVTYQPVNDWTPNTTHPIKKWDYTPRIDKLVNLDDVIKIITKSGEE